MCIWIILYLYFIIKLSNIKIKDKNLLEIYKNEITYSEQNMYLQPIEASSIVKQKGTSYTENPNIGVISLETYTDSIIQTGIVDSAMQDCIVFIMKNLLLFI